MKATRKASPFPADEIADRVARQHRRCAKRTEHVVTAQLELDRCVARLAKGKAKLAELEAATHDGVHPPRAALPLVQ